MPHGVPRLDQRVARDEIDRLAVCEQAAPIGCRQSGQQQILRKFRAFAPWHC